MALSFAFADSQFERPFLSDAAARAPLPSAATRAGSCLYPAIRCAVCARCAGESTYRSTLSPWPLIHRCPGPMMARPRVSSACPSASVSVFEKWDLNGTLRARSEWNNRPAGRDYHLIPSNPDPASYRFMSGLEAQGSACLYGADGKLAQATYFDKGVVSNTTMRPRPTSATNRTPSLSL